MVVNAEDYYFSSARNYVALDNDLEVEVVLQGRQRHGLQIRDIEDKYTDLETIVHKFRHYVQSLNKGC